jgi:pimeloyl-ACP methyl ester carboxylesterase
MNASRRSVFIGLIACLLLFGQALGQTEAPPQGHIAAVNGIEMYYEDFGQPQASALVLLHWFGVSGEIWRPVVPELEKHYRVIVVDLRGHGRSSNPGNRFTIRQTALDVFALLDQLGIQKFKGIGVVLGAFTLLHMATEQPERVEAMALVGGASYIPDPLRAHLRNSPPEKMTAEDFDSMRKFAKGGGDQVRALAQIFYNFKDSYDDVNFTPPYLSTITARTLIVEGDRDDFIPMQMAVDLFRFIPHSYLWILPNRSLFSLFDPQSIQEFAQMALKFMSRDWETKQ